MSKIVQAVNAMVATPDRIKSVQAGSGEELFFVYDGKYKWSMRRDNNDGSYHLWYYPGDTSIEALASTEGPEWEDVAMIGYHDKDIGTREAKASFAELYTIVKEKVFGMDEILDEIIKGEIPF
jgi:hypothetical protein